MTKAPLRKQTSKKRKAGKARRRRPARRPNALGAVARYGAEAGVYVFIAAIALAGVFAWFARDLPDTNGLWRADRQARITLLAADGAPLPLRGASAGAPVRLSELPRYVPDAVLAVEDRNFRHHIGVNPVSIVRALIVNLRAGSVRQGGSTITQQLAKNLFLSPERTMKRKIQELMLALWLEQRFTKDEILTLYLNRAYFGAGAHGIDAASHRYFAKPARLLSLGEAAVLAGLLKAPSQYAPTHNPEDAGARARLVIDAMRDAGLLTSSAAKGALGEPVVLAGAGRTRAPYFLDAALDEMRRLTNALDADLIVRTTLDLDMQEALEAGVAAGLGQAGLEPSIEIAAAILDASGAIRGLAGGRDYAVSQFNRASQARRQPGSAFKPFVFLAAMEQGRQPHRKILDEPISIGRWSPDNYNSEFFGEVTLAEALARSLNSAAIRLQEETGRSAVRLTARRMGLGAPLSAGPALALGVDAVSPIELAGAFVPFANGGYRVTPHAVAEIKTAEGRIAFRRDSHIEAPAASPQALGQVNAMLNAVTEWGTGRAARLPGVPVYGKTGTTQDHRDAWFVGHAGGLVCVVWLGHDDNAPMPGVTGGGAPAILWREIMSRALPAPPRTASAAAAGPLTTETE